MLEQHSFGYWLRLKRKALDLTREGLADRVGCSAATIHKLEDEERRPSAQIVERLAEIFNIPSNERTAFLRFARGDWRYAPGERIGEVPWQVSSASPRSNLPAVPSSLIGRAQEIALVREYLSNKDIRLVTLIGPPGIGKTRLSIESARQSLANFPDGVFFVALAPLDNPTLIAPTIAHALGYVGAKNISTNEQLMDGIGDKKMLLVLDNCEHLIEDVASLGSALLSACSRLKILATSRESLRIPGEWLYPVPAFEVPDESSSVDMENAVNFPALTLFAERARAVQPDFVLDSENIKTVSVICAQLDGLPLAIELIAARMRLMSPRALLERLNDQFTLSADGMRAASARQKTLNDAIGWSYNLLSAEEQKLFVYLSVFSGGFTLEAAESIFWGMFAAKSVSNLVTSLLDKSLLQRTFDARGEARFDMLVTIQQFALDHLRRMGSEAEVRNWHLAYFLALAEEGDKEMRGPNQIEWLHRLHVMRDNLRAALDWTIETGQTEAALQMARELHWFFFVRGDHNEGRQWLGRVLALPDASEYPGLYAEVLTQIAHHTWLQIGWKEARPLVEQALAVARAHGDRRNIAKALSILGLVMNLEHNFIAAQVTLEESKILFQEVHDDWNYAHAVIALALGPKLQDDRAAALALHEQALALFRKIGDRYFQSVALRHISDIHIKQGDWLLAQNALREALILARELGSTYEVAAVLWSLTDAVQGAGDYARAVRLNWAAKNIFELIGTWKQQDEKDESVFEEVLESCRAALDGSAFAAAVAEGRAMTLEQAVAYALEDSDG
jgi:predicted ATPase/transcriptional regulator with XRE-family HTH domain